ncbi:MAG: YciI family protein [Paucibacter sp.]|nr:YciI family protein [Roseateles sp.]
MRFMIIVRATAQSEAGIMHGPDDPIIAEMADYHAELAHAGVLLEGNGLKPSRDGWRISYRDGQRTVIDGPFAESKELIAGYTLIQVRSREEAMEWARRFPAPFGKNGDGGMIEVRPLYEIEDFGEQPGLAKFNELEAQLKAQKAEKAEKAAER